MNLRPVPSTVDLADWKFVDAKLAYLITDWSRMTPTRPLFLHGPTGVGKTSAAASVYRRWRASAYWYETGTIVQQLLDARKFGYIVVYNVEQGRDYEVFPQHILKKMAEASLVVFNELGTTNPSPTGYEALLELIVARRNKHTIYTSNVPPLEVREQMGDRILSRVCSGVVVEVTGRDRRMDNLVREQA